MSFDRIINHMSILIAEDNVAQRHYLRGILEKEFPSHAPLHRSRRWRRDCKARA